MTSSLGAYKYRYYNPAAAREKFGRNISRSIGGSVRRPRGKNVVRFTGFFFKFFYFGVIDLERPAMTTATVILYYYKPHARAYLQKKKNNNSSNKKYNSTRVYVLLYACSVCAILWIGPARDCTGGNTLAFPCRRRAPSSGLSVDLIKKNKKTDC